MSQLDTYPASDPPVYKSLHEQILEAERSIYLNQDRLHTHAGQLGGVMKSRLKTWGLMTVAVAAAACIFLPKRMKPWTVIKRMRMRRKARPVVATKPSSESSLKSYVWNLALSTLMPLILNRIGLGQERDGTHQMENSPGRASSRRV